MHKRNVIIWFVILLIVTFVTWWPASPWMSYGDSDFAYSWAKFSLKTYWVWMFGLIGFLIYCGLFIRDKSGPASFKKTIVGNLLIILGGLTMIIGPTIGGLLHICATGLDCL